MIYFAIADDHPLVRKAIAEMLTATGEYTCVIEAANGEAFIELLNPSKPIDLVLLDLMMPIKNGIETLHWLQHHHPMVKVVIISFYQDQPSIETLLALGADGYISKAWESLTIKTCLQRVIATPKVKRRLKRKRQTTGPELFITDREKKLLEYSSTELTYEDMADKLHISLKTIDKHRSALFKKLNVKSRARLVMTAIKLGMIKWWE